MTEANAKIFDKHGEAVEPICSIEMHHDETGITVNHVLFSAANDDGDTVFVILSGAEGFPDKELAMKNIKALLFHGLSAGFELTKCVNSEELGEIVPISQRH